MLVALQLAFHQHLIRSSLFILSRNVRNNGIIICIYKELCGIRSCCTLIIQMKNILFRADQDRLDIEIFLCHSSISIQVSDGYNIEYAVYVCIVCVCVCVCVCVRAYILKVMFPIYYHQHNNLIQVPQHCWLEQVCIYLLFMGRMWHKVSF